MSMINYSLSELVKHKKELDLTLSPLYKVTIDLKHGCESSEYIFDHVVDIIFNDSCICLTMADGCCAYFRTNHVINWIAEMEVDE